MGDIFSEGVEKRWQNAIWTTMECADWHTFLVLTKRPEKMREYVTERNAKLYDHDYALNIWLGVSVTNQQDADERIPHLLQTPAAVRFVSVEPMMGEVDLTHVNYTEELRRHLVEFAKFAGLDPDEAARSIDNGRKQLSPRLDVLNGRWFDGWDSGADSNRIDWLIVGAQTGPGAIPPQREWVEALREQCQAAGVPIFLKGNLQAVWQGELIQQYPVQGGAKP
jgi:protein gp37